MIAGMVFVCAFIILLDLLIAREKTKKRDNVLFCKNEIHGKFIDDEISIDDVEFKMMEKTC